jgi:hypothetical protein
VHPILFEAIAFGLIAFFVITQVILPSVLGLPMFPWFKFRKPLNKLEDIQAEQIHKELEQRIADATEENECDTTNRPSSPEPVVSSEASLSEERSSH